MKAYKILIPIISLSLGITANHYLTGMYKQIFESFLIIGIIVLATYLVIEKITKTEV